MKKRWSGKRDSNPRPSAWEADALPTELFPLDAIILLPLFEPVNAPERPRRDTPDRAEIVAPHPFFADNVHVNQPARLDMTSRGFLRSLRWDGFLVPLA